MGGDEFVVLLRNEDYRNREELLAEFDRRAGEIDASTSNPWERVDMARGMAQFHPGEDSSVEDVLRRADSRMYADKRTSRR
jgi:GGDEF domain-containing protein